MFHEIKAPYGKLRFANGSPSGFEYIDGVAYERCDGALRRVGVLEDGELRLDNGAVLAVLTPAEGLIL